MRARLPAPAGDAGPGHPARRYRTCRPAHSAFRLLGVPAHGQAALTSAQSRPQQPRLSPKRAAPEPRPCMSAGKDRAGARASPSRNASEQERKRARRPPGPTGCCEPAAVRRGAEHGVDPLRVAADDQQRSRTGHRRGQRLRGDLVRTAVDRDDHNGPAGGTLGARRPRRTRRPRRRVGPSRTPRRRTVHGRPTGAVSPVVSTRMSPGARPESSSRSTASSAASMAPSAGAGISWSCAPAAVPGSPAGGCGELVRCAGGAATGPRGGAAGPGLPGRTLDAGAPRGGAGRGPGPGTGRGVGAVRPAAGVARGPGTLS